MIKRWLFTCVCILVWTSAGLADVYIDWGYAATSSPGPPVVVQQPWGIALPIASGGLLVAGYLGQNITTDPGSGDAAGAHGGYVTGARTGESSVQSSTIAGFQIGSVSGSGNAQIESHAFGVTWQYQQ